MSDFDRRLGEIRSRWHAQFRAAIERREAVVKLAEQVCERELMTCWESYEAEVLALRQESKS